MSEYITDPAGDIYARVVADRAMVDSVSATYVHTATEMHDWLYGMIAAAYLRRDVDMMLRSMQQLCNFMGWEDGGGKTAYDVENTP